MLPNIRQCFGNEEPPLYIYIPSLALEKWHLARTDLWEFDENNFSETVMLLFSKQWANFQDLVLSQ